MRIAQLSLLAFGPFRGLELDLSAPGVHVVFGRNEAGKSTTLRAITGLLYGIGANTPDAHVHKPSELRVGGVLVGDDGSRVRIVRRKGVSKGAPNTLLDERGESLDEAVVQRLLHGVSEETFRHAFGLDHDTLQLGAKALLEGRGDIGGSLFDASVGGGNDARRLLVQLTEEADRIYKPRASAPPLNEALKQLADAQKSVKELQSLPEAYVKQVDALEEAKARRTGLATRRAELSARRAQLERARRRVPAERKRAQLAASLLALGEIARHAARIASLHSRLAAYERAIATHRDESTEAQRLRDRVADAARRAGVPAGSAALRIDARKESRIQRLVNERTTLSDRIETSRAELAKSERELARARAAAETPSEAEPAATSALLRAVTRARALGDATTRHASETTKAARRRKELEAKAASLGGFEGALDVLVALRLPSPGALDELAARSVTLERALTRQVDRLAELESQTLALEQQLAEASGDFAPPTAADLRAARDARDAAWERVQDARNSSADRASLDSSFDRVVREADVIADRMIVEADRVTTLARIRAQEATFAQQRLAADAEREKLVAERAALDDEHRALWEPSHVTVGGLAEMRAWLTKHAQVVDAHADVRELELAAEETAQNIAAAREELASALGSKDDARLPALLDRATALVEQLEASRRSAEEAARLVAKLDAQIDDRKASLVRDEATLVDTRVALAELVGPLGVPDDASADEVTRALEALRELFKLEDDRVASETRSTAAGDEAHAFEEEATRAAAELASDLAGLPARDVVAELWSRSQRALAAEAQLREVEVELDELGHDAVAEDVALLIADTDAAAHALDEIEAELGELERDSSREDQAIGSYEAGLDKMRVDSGAAEASARAQEALARVRFNVERYARAKVASVLLAREIERYREENQGPMLSKASQLFARLTLGGFTGVRAGYNDKDKPALRCVREGNVEVDVEGLSEGTRDQLYLSLRLASLLRYADLAEPMPLVVDDILIQFDDERSHAALQIIAELSTRMQVLFFTHHARLVDQARSAIPAESLTVHELTASPIAPLLASASV